jgi:hypothetical protein
MYSNINGTLKFLVPLINTKNEHQLGEKSCEAVVVVDNGPLYLQPIDLTGQSKIKDFYFTHFNCNSDGTILLLSGSKYISFIHLTYYAHPRSETITIQGEIFELHILASLRSRDDRVSKCIWHPHSPQHITLLTAHGIFCVVDAINLVINIDEYQIDLDSANGRPHIPHTDVCTSFSFGPDVGWFRLAVFVFTAKGKVPLCLYISFFFFFIKVNLVRLYVVVGPSVMSCAPCEPRLEQLCQKRVAWSHRPVTTKSNRRPHAAQVLAPGRLGRLLL